MNTLSRKQREIQERENRILEVSRPILLREGYHGLRMDRVAEQLEYSKGTIYNHFDCKEEIIIALAIQTTEKRLQLFQQAASFQGRPRERMVAIRIATELFVMSYPEHFLVEQIIRGPSIWEKASEKRRNTMRSCESRCMGIVAGIVRDAIARNDIRLPAEMTPEDLVFGLWSLTYGAHTIIKTTDSLSELGIAKPFYSSPPKYPTYAGRLSMETAKHQARLPRRRRKDQARGIFG
ncbi:MAG: TetR/AcrR family transcriptional regulator [Pirellulaceae bacterium]